MRPSPFVPFCSKGFAAHEAMRMLGLPSGPFWQDESYDRLVRNQGEFARIQRYIE
jgi:hypothetical protein